jgi:Tfp pilus assembly protein PilX
MNLPNRKNRRREKGQALLLVVLMLSVVLVVVLSYVSRSITDVSISTYQEESVGALAVAEAGIESDL